MRKHRNPVARPSGRYQRTQVAIWYQEKEKGDNIMKKSSLSKITALAVSGVMLTAAISAAVIEDDRIYEDFTGGRAQIWLLSSEAGSSTTVSDPQNTEGAYTDITTYKLNAGGEDEIVGENYERNEDEEGGVYSARSTVGRSHGVYRASSMHEVVELGTHAVSRWVLEIQEPT